MHQALYKVIYIYDLFNLINKCVKAGSITTTILCMSK